MKPEVRDWIEKITERASIKFEDTDFRQANILRGMYYCAAVGWKKQKIVEMVELMRQYGEPEETIDDIRSAWEAWL